MSSMNWVRLTVFRCRSFPLIESTARAIVREYQFSDGEAMMWETLWDYHLKQRGVYRTLLHFYLWIHLNISILWHNVRGD